jgi:transcriptional regulator with GAF, ATPase, and Fis domain
VEDAVRDGSLRADLFHRLSVLPVHLPPLRERLEDILPLARRFLSRHPSR